MRLEDQMRKSFHLARAKADAIRAQSAPLVAERDALARAYEAQRAELDAKIKAIEAPLFDLDNEIGMIVRGLRGPDGKASLGKSSAHCSASELEAARKV